MRDWIEANPDRWYTVSYDDLAIETGVSKSTLYRHFILLLARKAGILPSAIQKKRSEQTGWKHRLSDEEVKRIRELIDAGKSTLDIVFLTGRTPWRINRMRRKMEKESEIGE